MRKIRDALQELIAGNPLLQLGLRNHLLNLTKTADFLLPLIEAKTQKPVTQSAITMALSRLQRELPREEFSRTAYRIDRLTMQTGLSTFTYMKTPESHAGVHKLYLAMQKSHGYMTLTEGTNQITVIVESLFRDRVKSIVGLRSVYEHHQVASVGVSFSRKYLDVPGFMAIILQQMMLLSINIIEMSSTFTELVLYIAEPDLRVAYEALEAIFIKESERGR